MSQDNPKRSTVEALLDQGLELYGRNEVADAVRCWRRALSLAPGDRRALEYLEAAGARATPTPPPVSPSAVVIELSVARAARAEGPPTVLLGDVEVPVKNRAVMERLLQDRRYEEALQLLYKEREQNPEEPAISRGIRLLKEHLVIHYGRELGSLDWVPDLVASEEVMSRLPPEHREVLRLVDGVASFGDVLGSSRLGRFETYRFLAALLKRGSITARAPSVATPVVRESRTPAQRPRADEPAPITRPSGAASSKSSVGRYVYVAEAPIVELEAQPIEAPAAPAPRPTPAPARVVTPAPPTPRVSVPAMAVAPAPPPLPAAAPAADIAPPTGDFDALFEQATEAYLSKDYREAMRLYEECLALRPGEFRAEHNLRKLRQLTGW